jgi:hypothetical protein
MKNVNYWETYSPVVGWATIRMFLILMLINGWSSRQEDFVLWHFPKPTSNAKCTWRCPKVSTWMALGATIV